jgi:casein kinase II subunit alpha
LTLRHSKKQWKKLRTAQNEEYVTNEAIDLISKMLLIDHSKRITAREAMSHPYFAELNKETTKKEDKS